MLNVEMLKKKSDDTYGEYVRMCCYDTKCLGAEAKLRDGTFGMANLEALMKAAEFLGKHRAYAEMLKNAETGG